MGPIREGFYYESDFEEDDIEKDLDWVPESSDEDTDDERSD